MLQREICERFGVRHSILTSTGRAGLTVLLRAMRRMAPPDRDEVVIPAYTCYSVAASVVKAGLRPRLVDIDPVSLDYAPDELAAADFSRVLAIIATNLYGFPNDMPSLADIARRNGVFLIDDAAQAMGASTDARFSGTWGDAGLFSFDKGKNVSAIDGGVVVTNSDALFAAIEREMAAADSAGWKASAIGASKAMVYSLLLRPSLYGFPNRIPQLGLGQTRFTTEFPIEPPPRALAALALTMLPRLPEFTAARTANAAALREGLAGQAGLQVVTARPNTVPACLRLPVLFRDASTRDRAVDALNAAGIGASRSYPASLADVPELRGACVNPPAKAEGSRLVARHIATLPTHAYVGSADIKQTLTTISRVLGSNRQPFAADAA